MRNLLTFWGIPSGSGQSYHTDHVHMTLIHYWYIRIFPKIYVYSAMCYWNHKQKSRYITEENFTIEQGKELYTFLYFRSTCHSLLQDQWEVCLILTNRATMLQLSCITNIRFCHTRSPLQCDINLSYYTANITQDSSIGSLPTQTSHYETVH